MATIKSIGILTSGGDAPGMNAAIRAVTRSAIYNGLKVYGIYRGYKGLVTDEIQEFKTQNVSNIIQMGGTILNSALEMGILTRNPQLHTMLQGSLYSPSRNLHRSSQHEL